MEVDETIRQRLMTFQRIEITEHHIYRRLARVIRPAENQQVLEQIAQDELRHSQGWERYTGQEARPDQLKIWFYSVVKDESFRARFLEMAGLSLGVVGLSFVIGYLIRTFLGIEV